ncbi:MAG: hypothetical protein GX096_02350 [Clostridiales bacterium]|nr:hypothetical protein [Clostridiales bacterium]
MTVTLILSLIIMALTFLMILAAVAFIQSKKPFGSAPKDVQAAIADHDERFFGARIIGWIILAISLLSFLGAFIYTGWNGIQKGYSFWMFAARFVTMLYLYKAFDIVFWTGFYLQKHISINIISLKQRDVQASASLALTGSNSLLILYYFR